MTHLIDFSKLGGPVYMGRAPGAHVRQRLKIDSLDAEADPVRVLIPEETYAVTSSFFQGMFGPSVTRFGSRPAFLQHYRFEGPRHILEILTLCIDRILASRDRLAGTH